MTVVVRRIIATPARSASTAWATIVDLLAPDQDSDARKELESVAGVASSLISDEAFKNAPSVVYGSGPRVRIYCLYDEESITGDNASESALAFVPTNGDWRMSLPCPTDDLDWVQNTLKKLSSRITARDVNDAVADENSKSQSSSTSLEIDREAFLNL